MMTEPQVISIRGRWVWAFEGGTPRLLQDRYVIVEGDTISAITKDRPSGVDQEIEIPEGLVLPGLINLHNHLTAAVQTRGLSEEMGTTAFAKDLVYSLLLPMGQLANEQLSDEELRAIVELGLLEIIKGGTTTMMEMFRPKQDFTFECAKNMGVRFYGAPYLFSNTKIDVDENGKVIYREKKNEEPALTQWRNLYDRFEGEGNGRIRMVLGPHGTDTVHPDLLREVRRIANERGCLITTHLSQSPVEQEIVASRYGSTPVEFLDKVGILGPDLLAAHCIYTTEADLDLMRVRGATVINCPRTFSRGGVTASFGRFAEKGLRTTIATDGYRMDMVTELRAAGMVSMQDTGKPQAATSSRLFKAVTLDAADALGRTDLGRIAPGARADIIVIDMCKPHIQPVYDPIKNYVWNGNSADVSTVVIDGRVLVRDGRYLLADEREIVRKGAAAVQRLWAMAPAQTIIERMG